MSVCLQPSLSNIANNASAAAFCISKNDLVSAQTYFQLASGELTVLKRGGENQQTQELSFRLTHLKDRMTELYEKQQQQQLQAKRYVAVKTKTLFPIRVTYDAGFGNALELRGTEAAGLSWEQGKALICKGPSHWELDLDFQGSFEYKLVLRKADGATVWENLQENRTFSISEKTAVDYLEPIVPVFENV